MANRNRNYVYGNVVTKPVYKPDVVPQEIPREKEKTKPLSKKSTRNRKRERQMNAGYVAFLGIAAVVTLLVCVSYIRLQSSVTKGNTEISTMQTQLSNLREANNAKEGSVTASIDMNEVRDRAINELGMVYAVDGQIVEYNNPSADYVKQLEKIPEKGTLAKSDR